jgi:hypothetical protein
MIRPDGFDERWKDTSLSEKNINRTSSLVFGSLVLMIDLGMAGWNNETLSAAFGE